MSTHQCRPSIFSIFLKLILTASLHWLPISEAKTNQAQEEPTTESPYQSLTLTFPELPPSLFKLILGIDEPAAITINFPAHYDPRLTYPILCFIGGAHGGSGHSAAHARRIVGALDFICISVPSFKEHLEPLSDDASNRFSRQFISPADGPFIWRQYKILLEAAFHRIPNARPEHSFLGGFSNGANTTAALLSHPSTHAEVHQFFNNFILIEGGHRMETPVSMPSNAWFIAWGETANGHLLRPIADAVEKAGGRVSRHEMPDTGHRFPQEAWPALREWLAQVSQP